jgi:uncharacterized surface protein with fasciclin (FAS1) repeats
MARFMKIWAALLTSALIAACGSSDDNSPRTLANIDQVAQEQGFSALVAAATKAGLVSALGATNGQLTLFAPTDAAFENLATSLGFANATAMVEALPASTLNSILSYHVLPARKTGSDLISGGGTTQSTLYNFEGQPATLTVNSEGSVKITDAALTTASVTTADVAAGNGIIHAVDKVLIPPGVLSVVQMAQINPLFSSLVDAVVAANLQGTLGGAGPFTVFAPTDTAFAAAPTGLTTQQLATVLTYHVLGTQVLASQIPFGTPVTTVAGQPLTINNGTPPTITDTTATPARITTTDVRASNGVIHVIDKVLIPAL